MSVKRSDVVKPICVASVAANAHVEKNQPTCSTYAFNRRILFLRSWSIKSACFIALTSEFTGAARLYRAASSDRRERG